MPVLFQIHDSDSDQVLKDKLRKIFDHISKRLDANDKTTEIVERVVTTSESGGGSSSLINHASTHEDGGADELDLTDMSGLLATQQTPIDHDHSGDTGDGGQLDWDDVWSDAVHDHSTDAEGGQLDWDACWSDAVHTHQSDAEGGTLDHGAALTGLTDDDHSQYLKEKDSGGIASEVPTHTHQDVDNCGQLDHGLALAGLTDDDHTQYVLANGTRDIEQSGEFRIGDGTNYTEFKSDGEINLVGTARVWKSWDVAPDAVKLPGANPPAEDNKDGFAMLRFNRGTEESVYYLWTVPTNFATGDGSVKGYFKFLVENPPAGGGSDEVVRMGFEYKKISDAAVFDFTAGTSSGIIDETIAAGETAEIIHHTSEGICTTTGWVVGDTILFRFYRDATAVEDTYDNEAAADDNDVWVFDFHMKYLADKLGEAS